MEREISVTLEPILDGLQGFPCVRFVVSDNGGGMSRERANQVGKGAFDPQQEKGRSGRALLQASLDLRGVGGWIEVASSEPGKGTSIVVVVPVRNLRKE